ncbi:MAG TPA: cob(I)yrinic acid a,c-diamide adenosyltransferase [Planctomycetota bacterium]|nr:cob(I)yrinic acid a,c-diamide adenosyltransferase [Planctomycetota bacterium]
MAGRKPRRQSREAGLLHVYTGTGKGKTTAAWGLALRAAGHGLRVKVIEFIKGPRLTGEHAAARRLGRKVSVETCGLGFYFGRSSEERRRHRMAAERALARARRALSSGRWDVVVLDEAAGAAALRLISTARLLDALRGRAAGVEAVVTGRGAPPALRRAADYLTEMCAVRHPQERGVDGRRGVEF